MKRIKQKVEGKVNKKGGYSVLIVMLSLILVLAFSAYNDILHKSFIMNEVQQRLDTAGLNALNESVDTKRLKWEELAIDENNRVSGSDAVVTNFKNKITQNYKREVYSQIRTNDKLKTIQIKRVNVGLENSSFGTGSEGKVFPQVTLDSVIYMELTNSERFDIAGTNTQEFYDAKSGTNFSVRVVDAKEDGTTAMLVRSSTRIVYR